MIGKGLHVVFPSCYLCGSDDVFQCPVCDRFVCQDCAGVILLYSCRHRKYEKPPSIDDKEWPVNERSRAEGTGHSAVSAVHRACNNSYRADCFAGATFNSLMAIDDELEIQHTATSLFACGAKLRIRSDSERAMAHVIIDLAGKPCPECLISNSPPMQIYHLGKDIWLLKKMEDTVGTQEETGDQQAGSDTT